mgnify:CR=1 FL=1
MSGREPPLTEQELSEIREIILADRRAKWLGATIRTWAIWIAAVVGGATVFWDAAERVLKTLVGK